MRLGVLNQTFTHSKRCATSLKGAFEGLLASVCSGVLCQVATLSKCGTTFFEGTLEGLVTSVHSGVCCQAATPSKVHLNFLSCLFIVGVRESDCDL